MKKTLLGAAIALSLGLTAPAGAQDRVTVMLDWFPNPNHGPIYLAEELGYYAEAGLEVEITPPADAALPPAMVAAGRVDIAVTYQPELHLQVAADLDLIRIGALVSTPLNCVLAKADGPIEELSDLEGRRVGYSVAGVEFALMSALLEPVGLTTDDVEMIDVAFNLTPAVLTDQVDAVIGAYRNFELTQMRLEGFEGRCFYIEEHGVPTYEELVYVAQASVMRDDPAKRDAARRFIAATERATAYMINHPQESWEIFRAISPEFGGDLNQAAWFDTLPRFALRPGAADPARYTRFADFLFEAGLIDAPQSADMLVIDLGAME